MCSLRNRLGPWQYKGNNGRTHVFVRYGSTRVYYSTSVPFVLMLWAMIIGSLGMRHYRKIVRAEKILDSALSVLGRLTFLLWDRSPTAKKQYGMERFPKVPN